MGRTETASKPPLWERFAQRPFGTAGAVLALAGWLALVIAWSKNVLPLQVAFFMGVGLLTLVLSCLLFIAALISIRRPDEPLFRPWKWLRDFENYFRWLTPLAFVTGMIFAHYYWH